MSKKLFKRLVAAKSAELRKWANNHGLTFKTTSEIERERAAREREQERLNRERGRGDGYGRHRGNNGFKSRRDA